MALDQAGRLLEANSFERVLERGFALVTTSDGVPVKRDAEAAYGATVQVRFADGDRLASLDPDTDEAPGSVVSSPRPAARRKAAHSARS